MDRDAKGRFVKGNKASPGRPPRATEQEYLDKVLDVVPLDRFARMVEKQAQRADRGDIRAFESLAKLMRLYVDRLEHTGKDGNTILVTLRRGDDNNG